MTLKASVSISDSQSAFAQDLVAKGRFSSLSAVVRQGLELLRAQTEREEAELDALRAFFRERRGGAFEDAASGRAATGDMIAAKRAVHGL